MFHFLSLSSFNERLALAIYSENFTKSPAISALE